MKDNKICISLSSPCTDYDYLQSKCTSCNTDDYYLDQGYCLPKNCSEFDSTNNSSCTVCSPGLIKLRQIPVNLGTVKNHHKINNVKTASQVTIIIQQTKYVKCKTAINLTLETINAMHVTVDTKSINKTNLVG